MAKCNDNRKRRRRRDKKFLQRLAEKRLTGYCLKAKGGANPEYHTVHIIPRMKLAGHVRQFDLHRTRFAVVPNQKYLDMMRQLAQMCDGVTVDLSSIRQQQEEEHG